MSSNNTASSNPGNFANRPTEEVKAIASMGGKTAHSNDNKSEVRATRQIIFFYQSGLTHTPGEHYPWP